MLQLMYCDHASGYCIDSKKVKENKIIVILQGDALEMLELNYFSNG